ncbi:MAG TPA: hypothetical protein PLM24_08335 [Methanothrix sp.]|nr:hypothetical protein [Methanothrix sp.]
MPSNPLILIIEHLDKRIDCFWISDFAESPDSLRSDVLVFIFESIDERIDGPGIADFAESPDSLISDVCCTILQIRY